MRNRASTLIGSLLITISTTVALSLKMTTPHPPKIIDSHLHVWASSTESSQYPYTPNHEPPPSTQNIATTPSLLTHLSKTKVDGALIIQPIHHKLDHSYVASALKSHPDKFKGMLLHNPTEEADVSIRKMKDLMEMGFVGVRFNPYLWPQDELMSDASGMKVYKQCGEWGLPVGIMCFKGLGLHVDDIVSLIKACPETDLILDHFGFCPFTPEGDSAFEQLLALARYSKVNVKISALFRLNDVYPYDKIREKRFGPLVEAYGMNRLMFGTDFPFVLGEDGGYEGVVDVVSSWVEDDKERLCLMCGTAERLFGVW